MASNSFQMTFEILVKALGSGKLEDVERAAAAINKQLQDMKSSAQIDEILNVRPAIDKINQLKAALAGLRQSRQLREIGDDARFVADNFRMLNKPLDIDVSKIKADFTALGVQARNFYQHLTTNKSFKLDLDVSKAATAIDKLNVQVATFKNSWVKPLKVTVDTAGAVAAVNTVTAATQKATAAKNTYTAAVKQSTAAHGSLNTALGNMASHFLFARRVFIALVGVNLGQKILETVSAFDKLNLTMKTVFQNDASQELAFIRTTADRLGLSITDLGGAWAKFAASVDPAKVSMQTMRDNFLGVAEAGSALGLSTEEINGTLTALTQIASKGRLSMEELRQQLGDRLPGAVKIAAESLGLTQARLFALIEQGKISSDVFLNVFPKALRASFGTDSTKRIETLGASIQRFRNSVAELLNSVARSGALEAFTKIIGDMATKFKDPVFIEQMQGIAKAITVVVQAAVAAAKPLGVLLLAFLAFKTIAGVNSGINAFANSIARLITTLGGVHTQLTTIPAKVTAVGTAATGAATATTTAASAATRYGNALGILGGMVTALAALYVVGSAAASTFVDWLIKGEEAANKLAEAQRDIASNDRLSKEFAKQANALGDYAGTVALTAEQINKLQPEIAKLYVDGTKGALDLAEAQRKSAEFGLKSAEAELKMLRDKNDNTAESRTRINELLIVITKLRIEQEAAAKESTTFAAALAQLAAKAENIVDKGGAAATILGRITVNAEDAAEAVKAFSTSDLGAIAKDVQGMVDAFSAARTKAQDFGKALESAIPKDWLETGTRGIMVVANGLDFLVKSGLVPAQEAADKLEKELSGLSAEQLQKFAITADAAFQSAQISAEGFALVLQGQLQTSLKQLGIDAQFAGTNVTKSFKDMVLSFETLATNAKATGAQIKEGLDVAVQAAKTTEELLLLKDTIEQIGLASGKFSTELQDSLTRLEDKIRLTAGAMNNALGDSFQRLGITSKTVLENLAKQAEIDFARVKASGMASALEIEAAFRKMVEEVTKANNGIPPISLKFEAINANAFDVLVGMAQKASERIKKAMLDAIPLADTQEKLRLLAEGIEFAFERGRISVNEFREVMFTVGQNLRDAIAKPVGEVAAIVEKFGYKTKDMLQATADNARETFDTMRFSGEFTTQELAKAAQAYMDAYKAANNGVVDSFDPVLQKAMEVVNSINEVADAATGLSGKMSEPISTGNLRDKNVPALQLELDQLSKAYRAIGIQNVQDLQIIQEIQKEIARQSKIDAEERRRVIDEASKSMGLAADNLAQATGQTAQVSPGGGGGTVPGKTGGAGGQIKGGDTFNINLNGTGQITPDQVKRQVVPILSQRQLRTR